MELALYAPGLGYYSAGAAKLGASGDFITAPEISALFGRCLARQCYDILGAMGSGDILELGAGSGRLAVDLLEELERLDLLPGRYLILELSADLRARQQQLINDRISHLCDRVEWLDRLPEQPVHGIVIANEVLDALPVHCIQLDENGMHEMVVAGEGDGFTWQQRPLNDRLEQAFRVMLAELPGPLPAGYRTEINTGLHDWFAAIAVYLQPASCCS
ncbi:MAG: class I SAM-dependent methyltransferase [Gammaproteobacteria bacterium]|nr:class I SAM-dependent methyltransferase [Gammaproteobacteria bacterium]